MKIKSFGVAALALVAQSTGAVTLYGKANVALQHADEAGNREIELQSNSSRIGLMGDNAIAEDVLVIYRFEYETSVDDGDKDGQTLTQRNIYLGLQTNYGTLMGGVYDSPLKTSASKVDLFNDLEGDIRTIFAGENRSKNVVQYVSPKSWGPLTAKAAYVTKETDGIDGWSTSLAYDDNGLYLAAAVDRDIEENVEDQKTLRLVSSYTLGAVMLGAAWEKYEQEDNEGNGYFASVQWKLTDKWIFKTQYGESDIKVEGRETFSVGGDYKFDKRTRAFVYYTNNEDDVIRDDNYLGVGMELKF